ncbi:MAG: hypothetical protein R3F56_23240 [Planctomycetota bacterium]
MASLTLAALFTCEISAQTTYDDFSGTAIDSSRWFQFGSTARLTMSGGKLRIAGATTQDALGIFAIDGLRGDFELVVDYDSFAASASNGDPGLSMSAFDAFGPPFSGGELGLGLIETSSGREFVAEGYRNNVFLGGNQTPTTSSAGQLRLVRTGNTGIASFRASGQANWTVLATIPNLFASTTVHFIIETVGVTGRADFALDQVTYTGTRVAGSPLYGSRCLDWGATALGFPVVGNADFSLVADGGQSFANAPAFVVLGAQQTAIDLSAIRAPGCWLLASTNVVFAAPPADPFGLCEITMPIPNANNLVGGTLFFQVLAATTQNALGVAASNGVRVVMTR